MVWRIPYDRLFAALMILLTMGLAVFSAGWSSARAFFAVFILGAVLAVVRLRGTKAGLSIRGDADEQ
jgi:hypothetical protein